MRAAVFLAMEEQDKLEVMINIYSLTLDACICDIVSSFSILHFAFFHRQNKTPLINENLKKCLNTKDGELLILHVLTWLLLHAFICFRDQLFCVNVSLHLVQFSFMWQVSL